jgi:hypothetical protein
MSQGVITQAPLAAARALLGMDQQTRLPGSRRADLESSNAMPSGTSGGEFMVDIYKVMHKTAPVVVYIA